MTNAPLPSPPQQLVSYNKVGLQLTDACFVVLQRTEAAVGRIDVSII